MNVMDTLLTQCHLGGDILNIGITGGMISYIGDDSPSARETVDCSGLVLLPGMIDPHVHMRDLGQAEKEDWTTGSRAALAGGVTTLFDMPNTIPPLVDCESFEKKRAAAESSLVNYSFHAGVIEGELEGLKKLLETYGSFISGIKIFLAETSSNKTATDPAFLRDAVAIAAEYGKVVLFHHELASCLKKTEAGYSAPEYNSIAYHNRKRDPQCEVEGIRFIIDLAKNTEAGLYVCHVSTKEGYELIAEYKKGRNNLYCELTPHHTFLDESAGETQGNFAKINPPLRSHEDMAFLQERLLKGEFDALGSDHAPHQRASKELPYDKAPAGFPGLETSYPLLIDGYLKGELSFGRLSEIAAGKNALLFKLDRKSGIKEGNSADLVLVDPEAEWTVDALLFNTKAKYSPYQGRRLKGKIVKTMVNGRFAYDNGIFIEENRGEHIAL